MVGVVSVKFWVFCAALTIGCVSLSLSVCVCVLPSFFVNEPWMLTPQRFMRAHTAIYTDLNLDPKKLSRVMCSDQATPAHLGLNPKNFALIHE